jgi:serine/threonine-protein kinase
MGVVWVARSRGLGVDVALKLLHDASADEIAVERMAREARAAALLGHSAIVRVLDFGRTESGQPFMAMELLQGEDLYRLLKEGGRLSAVEAVSLLLPIVDALVIAHKHGIVHRDLKPENLFVARDALGRIEPKILDFGIAKLESADDKRLTQMGTLLGSPAYLSPEQAEGIEDVDHRVDIWSMGIVLYELITGELPFDGRTCNAILRSVARDRPRSITEFAAGNDALWAIVKKCLRKDPADRWASMQELGEALARWATEQGAEVDISSRSLRDAWLSSGAASRRMRLVPGRATGGDDAGRGETSTTQTLDSRPAPARSTWIRPRLARRFARPFFVACGVVAATVVGTLAWRALHPPAPASVSRAEAARAPAAPAAVAPSAVSGAPVVPDEPRAAPTQSNVKRATAPKRTRAAAKAATDAEFGF